MLEVIKKSFLVKNSQTISFKLGSYLSIVYRKDLISGRFVIRNNGA